MKYLLLICVLTLSLFAERAFTDPRKFTNLQGDVKFIGNTVLCSKLASENDSKCFDDYAKRNDETVLEATSVSSAVLNTGGKKILWARLYWQGRSRSVYCKSPTLNSNNDGSCSDVPGPNFEYEAFNSALAKNITLNNDGINVPLDLANIVYDTASSSVNYKSQNYPMTYYSASAQIKNPEALADGVMSITNLYTGHGYAYDGTGYYGAWTLVVIYEDLTSNYKNISVFDGYEVIHTNSTAKIPIKGFYTPKSGDVNSKLYLFTAEGDRHILGDTLEARGNKYNTTPWVPVGNKTGTKNNAFWSEITSSYTRVPDLSNNNGIDIQTIDLGDSADNPISANKIVTKNEDGVHIKLSSTGDLYFASLVVVATDLFTPDICYTERIENLANGTFISSGSIVSPGDELEFEVNVLNRGNEGADDSKILKTFEGEPFIYTPDSLELASFGTTTFERQDDNTTNGDYANQHDYNATFYMGTIYSASETMEDNVSETALSPGGTLGPNKDQDFRYRATLTNSSPVFQSAYLGSFQNVDLNIPLAGNLNVNECNDESIDIIIIDNGGIVKECGLFEDTVQTRASGSTVDFETSSAHTELNTNNRINTFNSLSSGDSCQDIGGATANDQPCIALGIGGGIQSDITMLTPTNYTQRTPVTTTTNNRINKSTVTDTELNTLKTNKPTTLEVTSKFKGNTLEVVGSSGEIKIESADGNPYDINIYEYKADGKKASMDTKARNIQIGKMTADSGNDTNFVTDNSIRFQDVILNNNNTFYLESKYIAINNLTVNSDSEVHIKADFIDLGRVSLDEEVTFIIEPLTADIPLLLRARELKIGDKNSLQFYAGDYYIETLKTAESTDGSKIETEGSVNLLLQNDYVAKSNISFNTDKTGSTDLCTDSNLAQDLFIYTNGDFTLNDQSRLVGTIYSKKDITLSASSFLKGAISAESLITIEDGSIVCYDDNLTGNIIANSCGGGTDPQSTNENNFDALDNLAIYPLSSYPNSAVIQTKVAGQSAYTFNIVNLDKATPTSPSIPSPFAQNALDPFLVIPVEVLISVEYNSTGVVRQLFNDNTGSRLATRFASGITNVITQPTTIPQNASKSANIELKFVDMNNVINSATAVCSNTNMSTNFNGLPICTEIPAEFTSLFGTVVNTNCMTAGSNGRPCSFTNGQASSGKYAHSHGCYECVADYIQNDQNISYDTNLSIDPFAIKPMDFNVSSSDPHWPNFLRAGSEYNLTLQARDINNNPTLDYNISNVRPTPNIQAINITSTSRYFQDNTLDSSNLLAGVISTVRNDFNMSDGLSELNGITQVVDINYSDVGMITLDINDTNWSYVDIVDTYDLTPTDCTNEGAYICGDTNVTFIPFGFSLNNSTITNSNGNPGTFTYYSTLDPSNIATYPMSARVDFNISAVTEDGSITQNFQQGASPLYWENPVGVVAQANDPSHGDGNVTTIASHFLNFGMGTDQNGTKSIPWNETDNANMLRFNFSKAPNERFEPLTVTNFDLNITVSSVYGIPPNTSLVTTDFNASKNGSVTFVSGRVHAPRYRVDGSDGNATIYYEVYCSTCTPNSGNFGGTIGALSVDDINWYQNPVHNVAIDGNITNSIPRGSYVSQSAINQTLSTTQLAYSYNENRGYPYKTTVDLTSNNWLIYSRFDPTATVVPFEIEFNNGGGKWVGKSKNSNSVDSNASTNTNRRLLW